jgi:hypothetical protein
MLPRTLESEVTIRQRVPDSFELLGWRLTVKRSEIFVQDVARPRSSTEIDSVVRKRAGGATGGDARVVAPHSRQRARFEVSLHAVRMLDESRDPVNEIGVPSGAETMTSARHWTLAHVTT